MSDVEDAFCVMCGRYSCVWDIDKSTATYLSNTRYPGVKVKGSLVERKQAQAVRRFYLYQAYTRTIYCVLGKGVRICHPQCLVEGIHNLAPDPANDYTGHVEVIPVWRHSCIVCALNTNIIYMTSHLLHKHFVARYYFMPFCVPLTIIF